MIRKLIWLAVIAAAVIGGVQWLNQRSGSSPQSSPRAVMLSLCVGIESANPTLMRRHCLPEAREQIDEIVAELDARARRGARVDRAWVDGNTGDHGGRAQGLIWIMDTSGNRLPRWDVYATRDDQGRWWIERLTDR